MINSVNIREIEEVRTGLYDIYKAYLLKHIESDHAIKSIIDYSENYEAILTKHLNTLLVRLTVKLLLRINPNHKLLYKYLESNIVDSGLTNPTKYYLYHVIETYFPTKIEAIQKFVLNVFPSFFPNNIEFDAVEVIKADLHGFLFKTYNTLSTYFPNQSNFKWDYTLNGFSNNNILILKKNTDPYNNESFSEEYPYESHREWEMTIKDGKKYFFIGKKNSIQLLQIGFALQIFKSIVENKFEESSLIISFSNNEDIPIKFFYEECDILLYFFASPSRKHDTKPHPKERKRPIDLKWFED